MRKLVALSAALIGSLPVAVMAADADFYKGKTLTMVVATGPGGGYDTYARLVSKHLDVQLPGVTVVIRNVPGAGHIIGANMIYGAKPDGLTIGTFSTGLMYAQIVGQNGIRFDLGKMSWVGKASTDPRVLITGTNSEFKTFQDIKNAKRDVKLGASGVGGNNYNESLMVSRTYKLPIKVIPGYTGSENNLGVMRGEIDGFFSGFSSVEPLVKSGRAQYIMQFGNDIPNVPNALALADSEDAKAVARLLNSQSELGRLTAGPPEIPADRLQVLRGAYRGVLESESFLAEARKLDLPTVPMYGDDIRNRVVEALAQPPAVRGLLKEITSVKAE
jgi:tripartite-type tricarboxylate transporter receptor subunit TctC